MSDTIEDIYIENLQVGTINIGDALNQSLKVVYVDPKGNDSNPGTKEAPFKTLQQAFIVSASQPSAEIRLSEGEFTIPPGFLSTNAMNIQGTPKVLQTIDGPVGPNASNFVGTITSPEPLTPGALEGKFVRTFRDEDIEGAFGFNNQPINPNYYVISDNTASDITIVGWEFDFLNQSEQIDVIEMGTTLKQSADNTIDSKNNPFIIQNCNIEVSNEIKFNNPNASIYSCSVSGLGTVSSTDFGNLGVFACFLNDTRISSNSSSFIFRKSYSLNSFGIRCFSGRVEILRGSRIKASIFEVRDCFTSVDQSITNGGTIIFTNGGSLYINGGSYSSVNKFVLRAESTQVYINGTVSFTSADMNPIVSLEVGSILDIGGLGGTTLNFTSNNPACEQIIRCRNSIITMNGAINVSGNAVQFLSTDVSSFLCRNSVIDITGATFTGSEVINANLSTFEFSGVTLQITGDGSNTGILCQSSKASFSSGNLEIANVVSGLICSNNNLLTTVNGNVIDITASTKAISLLNGCNFSLGAELILNSDVGVEINRLCNMSIDENATIGFTSGTLDFHARNRSSIAMQNTATITPSVTDASQIGATSLATSTLIGTNDVLYSDGTSGAGIQGCSFHID